MDLDSSTPTLVPNDSFDPAGPLLLKVLPLCPYTDLALGLASGFASGAGAAIFHVVFPGASPPTLHEVSRQSDVRSFQ